MKVYYLNSNSLENFREKVEENIEHYKKGKLKFVTATDLIRDPNIQFDDFEFTMDQEKPNESDFDNIKKFYLALKNLTDSQATEERLWAGLCHYSPFWEYLKYRWNCQTTEGVNRYYFFGDGIRSIFVNGLARLWWYGRITYDENSKDPFELTKYICENITIKGYLPITNAFSNNRIVYRIFLKTLMNFEKKHKLSQEEHESVRKKMGFWGGKFLLDFFNEKELAIMIEDYLKTLILNRKKD